MRKNEVPHKTSFDKIKPNFLTPLEFKQNIYLRILVISKLNNHQSNKVLKHALRKFDSKVDKFILKKKKKKKK